MTRKKLGDFEVHEAADVFPLIEGAEFDKLVDSIQAHGQLNPIIYCHDDTTAGDVNVLLDGRNRLRACLKLGREPKSRLVSPNLSNRHQWMVDVVVASNLERRQLTPGQKTMLAKDLDPIYAAAIQADEAMRKSEEKKTQAKTQSRQNGKFGKTPGDTVTGFPKNPVTALPKVGPTARVTPAKTAVPRAPRARDKAAKEVGTTGSAIARAKVIAKRSPELEKEVRDGKRTIGSAYKEVKAKAAPAAPSKAIGQFIDKIEQAYTAGKSLQQWAELSEKDHQRLWNRWCKVSEDIDTLFTKGK